MGGSLLSPVHSFPSQMVSFLWCDGSLKEIRSVISLKGRVEIGQLGQLPPNSLEFKDWKPSTSCLTRTGIKNDIMLNLSGPPGILSLPHLVHQIHSPL